MAGGAPTKAELLATASVLGVDGVDEKTTNADIQAAIDAHLASVAGNGPDTPLDIDDELAVEDASSALEEVQDDGTVWFSVGVGLINVTVGSVVCDRLLADGLKPVPAPED